MRRAIHSILLSCLCAAPALAQPVEFDPSDFGKIVVAKRQSAGTGFVLEQAFGDYQNEPVISYGEKSIARRLGRPVGRLDVLYGNGKTGYCTAFIVDTQHLVTNNHCIPGIGDPGVQAAQFVVGYIDAAHPDQAEKFQVALEPLETSGPLDYSVLRVFGDPSARYGKVELADADPENSEFLWIIGHPQGQAQHISREGCAAADPPVSTEGKVVHSCDTLGGNSGSPVFRISDRQVVALHHAGDSRTGFNFAIPMTRILAESQILKAAAPAKPPEVPETGQGACEVLWGAATQHGCLGYQTFLSQCGDHALAPLARGLAERSCQADNTDTTPKPDPDNDALRAEIDKALSSAEEQRAEITKEVAAAERAVRSLNASLVRARARAGDAVGSGKPGSAAVADLWNDVAAQIDDEVTKAGDRAKAMPRLLDDLDQQIDILHGATTQAELASVVKRNKTLEESSRERLAFVSSRKIVVDRLFSETETTVVSLLQDAVRDQTNSDAAQALRRSIDLAEETVKVALPNIKTVSVEIDTLLDLHDALVRDAYTLGAEARAGQGSADADISKLWAGTARSLVRRMPEVRSHANAAKELTETVETILATLPSSKTAAEANSAAGRVKLALDQSVTLQTEAAAILASSTALFKETETKAAALRATAESTFARPAVVTRCLEVSMPMFAVEGIAGVSRTEFNAGAAELACSAARKVSDDPAVHYGYVRALIERKRYSEAVRLLQNPRMDGFVPARYSMGVLYNTGWGVRKDYAKAFELYQETTAAGYPQGKFSLGVYYSLGRAVRADHQRAGALLVDSIADGYAHPITQLHKLSGATTRAIQQELVSRGYLNSGDVDGAFGPTTRGALERLAAAAAR